jgi:DNA polymerase Ligase (LigD)
MPRFVLLYHDCPPDYERPSHWDLMLESGNALRTWALAELPEAWQANESPMVANGELVKAVELADHRLAYLDYEGPVSGERGWVQRVDGGTYDTIADAKDCMEIRLDGRIVRGYLTLHRASDNQWTLRISSND